ncbi:MAG: right-handed parallel beta-helix repeat-containing protein [Myxococcales bacterium]|nr:right-handed parallel beta-helix repeat-containing protein [Myxococcales bacterium]
MMTRRCPPLALMLSLVVACGDDGGDATATTGGGTSGASATTSATATATSTTSGGGSGGETSSSGTSGPTTTSGATESSGGPTAGTSSSTGATTGGVDPSDPCPPLPAADGPTIEVSPDQAGELPGIVQDAAPGTTILFADGTYDLGTVLHVTKPGLSLRSASGDRDAVILDGGYNTGEVVLVQADDVTIADMTLQRAIWHPIHVTGADDHTIEGTLIYNVAVIDPGQQGIKINASADLYFADHGTIACSQIELRDSGRPHVENCYTGGIDAHSALGWVIRDNHIEGFWCAQGLSEHAVHFWVTGRDTLVERNRIVDCARGVGFGLGASGNGKSRDYGDDPCPGADYLGHIDGVIRNNMIFAGRPELFASQSGFDSGVALEQACGAVVRHNTVVSVEQPFVSMEYRWPNTSATIENNLVSHTIVARDGGQAALAGNIEGAGGEHFVDQAGGDLHLAPGSAAIDAGGDVGVVDDFDGDARDASPDVGADERSG